TVLFQAMIAPLLPFPFTGVIWYQGESNRERPQQYARLFPALVQDWRRGFGRPLPFYGVQIAPFAYRGEDGDDTARLRLAQAAMLGLEHTGLAITLDVGDAEDIHPAQKQQVGERLARLALARHYGKKVACDGPLLGGISMRGAEVRLHFTMATGGLVLERDGAGFELAGKDGHFVAAMARLDGDLVVVHADAVAAPVAVRYAWGSAPAWSLRNGAGLPAPPFERAIP
ncbi:MAG: sialate O-acetylesterase, partial [Planctomycetes bacterium]|nr:sialate O-acetylesterase [Planctomycetota bacterium]